MDGGRRSYVDLRKVPKKKRGIKWMNGWRRRMGKTFIESNEFRWIKGENRWIEND